MLSLFSMEDFVIIIVFVVMVCGSIALYRLSCRYKRIKLRYRLYRKEQREVIKFITDFSRTINQATDIDSVSEKTAHYLAKVCQAKSLAIFILDKKSAEPQLEGKAMYGLFPTLRACPKQLMTETHHRLKLLKLEVYKAGDGLIGEMIDDPKSILVNSANSAKFLSKYPYPIRTMMLVPMYMNDMFCGVIAVADRATDNISDFDENDLTLLESLSFQAALSENLIRIFKDRHQQERINSELEVSKKIQMSLLPHSLPHWWDLSISASSQAALEVAGDFYDFVEVDDNRLLALIADATGKGVPACMLMAMCRSYVHAEIDHFDTLENFVKTLNRRIFQDTDHSHFLTMAFLLIDKDTETCEYINAGHPPLLKKDGNGNIAEVNSSGTAIGLLPDKFAVDYTPTIIDFPHGYAFCLYTDGFHETHNENFEEYGMERLKQCWKVNDDKDFIKNLSTEVDDFCGGLPQDDQTIIVIKRKF